MKIATIDNVVAKVCKQRGIAWSYGLTTRCRMAVRKLSDKSRENIVKVLERVIKDSDGQ